MQKRIAFKGGVITAFADELDRPPEAISWFSQRVSEVLPAAKFKRLMFRLIRGQVLDRSLVANWTRRWTGPWIVVIQGQQFGPFESRQNAIAFEKDKVWEVHPACRLGIEDN